VALVKSYSVRFRNGFLRKRDAKCSRFLELAENTGLKLHVVGRQFAVRDLEDANMATFLSDLRHGIRTFLRDRGYAGVVIFTLALGIGANTTIFQFLNVLLQPLPFQDPDRVVYLVRTNAEQNVPRAPANTRDFAALKRESHLFEDLAADAAENYNLSGVGNPIRVPGRRATASFFRTMQVTPEFGRTFTADEEVPGKDHVVILGYGLWERSFGSDRSVLGRTLRLDGESYVIVGVMPQRLWLFWREIDAWTPLAVSSDAANPGPQNLTVSGRLKPGVSLPQAQSEIAAISRELARNYPATNAGWGVNILPFRQYYTSPQDNVALVVLTLVTSLVLVIACANVASLMLARGTIRSKEIAVRSALGASRWRVTRQLLTESFVLGTAGGGLGLLCVWWIMDMVAAAMSADVPVLRETRVDGNVVLFTVLLSLFATFLFALLPAWYVSRTSLNEVLQDTGTRFTGGVRHNRVLKALVMAEISMAVLLLIVATLGIRSIMNLENIPLGLNPDTVVTMQLELPRNKYPAQSQIRPFIGSILERTAALPGVDGAALADGVPIVDRSPRRSFVIDGQPQPPPESMPWCASRSVSSTYLSVMQLPLLRGRDFSAGDSATAPAVALISNTMARRYWPGKDPVGGRIRFNDGSGWISIVGIVGDVRNDDADAPPLPQLYVPFDQSPGRAATLIVKSKSDPLSIASAVRRTVTELDPDQPLYQIQTMAEALRSDLAGPRVVMGLLSAFGLLAALLSALGVYGLMSYSVAQRRHEIGIRLALGAKRIDVLKSVVGQAFQSALIGTGVGLVMAFAMTSIMSGMLFGIGPRNAPTFVLVAVFISGIAIVASYIPARRGSRIDPAETLR